MVFFNTHLDNDGEIARKEGVQLILNKIKEIAPHMPAIITGDFNCTPDETPLQTLEKGGMENASKVAAITYGPSWSFHDFVSTAGEMGCFIVEKHLNRFIEGKCVSDIKLIHDQMLSATLYYSGSVAW